MFHKKNRSYNHPSTIFEKIDGSRPSGTIDDHVATANFLKQLDEVAIGNDECYARRIQLAGRWFNEVVKSSRLLSAGT